MGWTSEGWFSRLSNSSRLSKCSFYVGIELGRVPEKQCERLAPSGFNTHVRKLAKKMHRRCETISLRNGTPSSLLPLTLSKYFYGLRTDRKITQMQARRGLWKSLQVPRSPKDVCLRVSVSVCYGVNVLIDGVTVFFAFEKKYEFCPCTICAPSPGAPRKMVLAALVWSHEADRAWPASWKCIFVFFVFLCLMKISHLSACELAMLIGSHDLQYLSLFDLFMCVVRRSLRDVVLFLC